MMESVFREEVGASCTGETYIALVFVECPDDSSLAVVKSDQKQLESLFWLTVLDN